MGKYYRNGKLQSADTFTLNGLRTLAGATAEQLWAGAAVTRPSPGGIQLGVASSSAQDAAAGTGIRTLRIGYLNSSGVRASETITMNGVAPVLTVATNIVEILDVTAATVGSSGAAVGIIQLRDNGGVTLYEQIDPLACSTLSAIVKVPSAQRGFITSASFAATVASHVSLCSDCNPATGSVVSGAKFVWHIDQAGQQGHNHEYPSPLGPFVAGARIWVEATGAAARIISASVGGYYEPEA